jgi:hypothetical protein
MKEVYWGPSPSVSRVLQRPSRHLWPTDRTRSSSTRFGRQIQTAWLHQIATNATTSYELCLGRSIYGWKYFHKASNGTGLISKFFLSRRESSKQKDVPNQSWCSVTVFWAVGPCIVSKPVGVCPRFGAWPLSRTSHAPHSSYTPSAVTNRGVFVCCKFSLCYFLIEACVETTHSPQFRTPPLRFQIGFISM